MHSCFILGLQVQRLCPLCCVRAKLALKVSDLRFRFLSITALGQTTLLFCHFFCHKYSYEMDSLEAQCQMNICKREPDELCNGAFIAYCNLGK